MSEKDRGENFRHSVTFLQNAAKDLIREGCNGMVVEASAERIAGAIVYLLGNPLVVSPLEEVRQYDWLRVTESLKKALT